MEVGVVGINHKSSHLHLREAISKVVTRCASEESGFARIILSTCNRTEIYFSGEDLPEIHGKILNRLRLEIKSSFEQQLYSYFHRDCFCHLAQVTTGLDSAILAESDIQRQVKLAYMNGSLNGELSSSLHFMFQKSLKIGKAIRSLFPEIRPKVTLEQMLFSLRRNLLGDQKEVSVLMIGNSQINRKILAYFRYKKGLKITLCTRGVSSASDLVEKYGVRIAPWDEVERWSGYHFIIAGSNYPEYLIMPEEDLELSAPILMVDLSMPRNIDPAMMRHPLIHLFNVDDISNLINQSKHQHLQEMRHCLSKIENEVSKQIIIFRKKSDQSPLCVIS